MTTDIDTTPTKGIRAWIRPALTALFLIGTVAIAALWFFALTARCEGFGCFGKGVAMAITLALELAIALIGAGLIWWRRHEGVPAWLWILELIHCGPLLWFLARLVTRV